MKKTIGYVFLMMMIATLIISGCAKATEVPLTAGMVKGEITFPNIVAYGEVHLCEVNTYIPESPLVPEEVNYSMLLVDWSADEGFYNWHGEITALDFQCEVSPDLVVDLGKEIPANEAQPLVFENVPSGTYTLVMLLPSTSTQSFTGYDAQLMMDANYVPVVFDYTEDQGLDIGALTQNTN